MASKIISGGTSGKFPFQKSEVTIDKKRKLLTYKSKGGIEHRRDLTLLNAPYDLATLRGVVEISDILEQCIEAYVTNVIGFGLDVRYTKNDDNETPEMKQEWDSLEFLLSELSYDRSATEILSEVLRSVESCGNGYIEVIRNLKGDVVGIDNLKAEFVQVTKLNRVIDKEGREVKVRYFRYDDALEDSVVTSGTWFKTFGDPTPLNTNGSVGSEGNGTATELIHIKLGDFHDPYGTPRWIGPLIKIMGNREADALNYRYFKQGRHIPLAILLENAQLTEASEQTLKAYSNGIGGENNAQHKIMILEAEKVAPDETTYSTDDKTKASIQIEKLADILQTDALFLEYNESTKQAVLSAFRLPPVYVGLSKDYNRATVETAKEITDEQVFQSLRTFYGDRIKSLFREYGFKTVEPYFKAPKLTRMEDIAAILVPAIDAGGVAPNDLRDLLSEVLNKQLENFDGDEYNLPMQNSSNLSLQPFLSADDETIEDEELDIEKAYGDSKNSNLLATVRSLIKKVGRTHD